MSARSYLSIGDVLTLLRQEFQDITISKIRFLESQGLVNPERTPSGYRKFYEHDVERLRWVLRQQREHFLPLKVIKDRLDDGSDPADTDHKGTPTAAPATGAVDPEPDSVGDDQSPAGDPVLVGHRVGADSEGRAGPTSAHPAGDGPLSLVGEGSGLPGIGAGPEFADEPSVPVRTGAASSPGPSSLKATRSGGSPRRTPDRGPVLELLDDGTPTGSRTSAGDPANGSDEGPAAGRGAGTATSGPVASSSVPTGPGSRRGGSSEPGPEAPAAGRKAPTGGPEADPDPGPAASPRTSKSRGKPGGRAAGTASRSAPSAAPSGAGGTSLSAEELAAASGLDLTVVRELQEYGLLAPSTMAGVEYFDEEALAVATVAAGFTRFGIEPRHLRLYKNAAEREAGFVEQVVLPLVRQRNPEARARAHETAEELAQLGQQLRGS
ncbi:MAG TPA: MerR family transcriptional regulator, partial [Acidimicrobiales bacterium]